MRALLCQTLTIIFCGNIIKQQVDLLVVSFYSHLILTLVEVIDSDDGVDDNIFCFTRTLH